MPVDEDKPLRLGTIMFRFTGIEDGGTEGVGAVAGTRCWEHG